MTKINVYSARQDVSIKGGFFLLSIKDVSDNLEVTRVTVYKWIGDGLIIPEGSQRIGNRIHHWFSPPYIEQIRTCLPKHRERGKSLLNDDVIERIKKVNRLFGKIQP